MSSSEKESVGRERADERVLRRVVTLIERTRGYYYMHFFNQIYILGEVQKSNMYILDPRFQYIQPPHRSSAASAASTGSARGTGVCTHQDGLPRALHAVQAQEERRRVGVAGVFGLVGLQPREEEVDAVLRLVVDGFGHFLFFRC